MKSRSFSAFYDGSRYEMSDSIGHLMKNITLAMRRRIEHRMAEHGLTAAQWAPLWMIATGQAGTAQELTCSLSLDAGAMTRLVDRLEAKGLVARERSSDDRRVVRLHLTDAGHAVMRHVPFVLAEVNNAALRGFDAQEFALLQDLLQRMLHTLNEEEPSA